MSKPTLKVTHDSVDEILKRIKSMQGEKVLVGIPESDNSRDDDSPIGNAAILFINNFGSPANNIPPRPVVNIGIFNAQDELAAEFKRAAQKALTKGTGAVTDYYNRTGMIAANSIKRAINSQDGIDPPAESTLKARERKGFNGTKALIVTGQTRNAITYVVKE